MNSAVAVFKRMNVHKAIADDGRMHHRVDLRLTQPRVGRDEPRHEFRDLVRLRTDVVNPLLAENDGFADVVLLRAVVGFPETRVHDGLLEWHELLLLAPAFVMRPGKQVDEACCPIRRRFLPLDGEGAFGLFRIEVGERPTQNLWRMLGDQ